VAEPLPSGHPLQRRVWTTPRALVAHAALVVWVPGCAVACWWQVTVALSGDSLGWVYAVMWPCFALFGTIFWWHFVHDDPDTVGRRGLRRLQQATTSGEARSDGRDVDARAIDARDIDARDIGAHEPDVGPTALERAEVDDPELAAYNDYLAALAREGRPGTWRGR
jgi:hypothetical protein